jgi:predicted GNAT superfamily acetyltransferase
VTTVDPEVLAAAERDAEAAVDRSRATVRTLRTHEELGEARLLWDAVWPSPTGTEVTNNHLRAIEHSGGYVGGAYDGDRMVGACLAFVGRSRSHDPSVGFHTHLHSHMAAVLPEAADRGIGTAIKLHQRAWALQHEIDRIVWTYDPLVRRNARLNLVKLGGVGVEYLVDFYGQMDDDLNRGEPSDRLLLQWDLATQRVSDALAGTTSALSSDDWIAVGAESALLVDARGPQLVEATAPVRLVAAPQDIVAIRHSDPELAHRWRLDVRAVLEPLISQGGRVVALTTDGHYVVEV